MLNGSTIKTLLDAENEKLTKAGKTPMKLVVYNTDTDAFQALRIGQVDAYGTTVETAGYYAAMAPDLSRRAFQPSAGFSLAWEFARMIRSSPQRYNRSSVTCAATAVTCSC